MMLEKIKARVLGRRMSRPSPPTIIALLALFISLGGTTYAAVNLPANSVGTRQLKNGAVSGEKLRNDAVSSSKVKNGSLLAKDFKPGQLPAGPRGPRGLPGATGQRGPSDAFNTCSPDLSVPALPNSSTQHLGSLGLPQGLFVIFGRVNISNGGSAAQTLDCVLFGPQVSLDLFQPVDTATVKLAAGETRTITLLGIAERGGYPLPAHLECYGPTTGPLEFTHIQLSAIQVTTWHSQPSA
jgi:hypothetical protein